MEINIDDRTPEERKLDGTSKKKVEQQYQQNGSRNQGPPGAEIMLDLGPSPQPRPENVERFTSQEEMTEAWTQETEDGFERVSLDPEYRAEVEARTIASIGSTGPWGDVAWADSESSVRKPMKAPLPRLEHGPDSAMIEIDDT